MKWTVSNVTQIDIELPWIIDDKPTGGRSSQQQQRKEKLELTIVAIGGLADWRNNIYSVHGDTQKTKTQK